MKKMKNSIVLLLSLTTFAVVGDDSYDEYGGVLSLWPKNPGLFLFVNAQDRISEKVLSAPVGVLAEEYAIDIRQLRNDSLKPFDIRMAGGALKSLGAKGGIWIVDDSLLPVSFAAIEDGWGVLNVAPILADSPDSQKLDRRLLKLISRLFAEIHGVSDPVMMPGCVMKQAIGIAGVDGLNCSSYSPEVYSKISSFLVKMGYKKKLSGTYMDACEEGWAPPPTNAIQKAIWKKVHQLPTKPLTIKRESERRK